MLGDDPPHPLGLGDGDLHAHQLLAGAAEDDIDAEIPEHRDNGFMNPHHRLPIESARNTRIGIEPNAGVQGIGCHHTCKW